jgi:5-methylcytosine-specific restriction endonuclease McrA
MGRPNWQDTRAVREVRRIVLDRAGGRCEVGLPGCTLTAAEVDHITPLASGGSALDLKNCRAACSHCNASLGSLLEHARKAARVRTNSARQDRRSRQKR